MIWFVLWAFVGAPRVTDTFSVMSEAVTVPFDDDDKQFPWNPDTDTDIPLALSISYTSSAVKVTIVSDCEKIRLLA